MGGCSTWNTLMNRGGPMDILLRQYLNREKSRLKIKPGATPHDHRRLFSICNVAFFGDDTLSVDVAPVVTLGYITDLNLDPLIHYFTLGPTQRITKTLSTDCDSTVLFHITRNDQKIYASIQLRFCSGKVSWYTQPIDRQFNNRVFHVRGKWVFDSSDLTRWEYFPQGTVRPLPVRPGAQIVIPDWETCPMVHFEIDQSLF